MQTMQPGEGQSLIWSALRPGQQSAIKIILDRWKRREPTTGIVLPPRYGKSDVIRISSLLGGEEKIISGAIILVPATQLREQIVDKEDLVLMSQRYGISLDKALNARWTETLYEQDVFANREYLVATTMQWAVMNPERMGDLAESMAYRCGMPVAVHWDESHEVGDKKKRGQLVDRLIKAGALLTLHTATPIRADGMSIPGFTLSRESCEDTEFGIPRKIYEDGELKTRIFVYRGIIEDFSVSADHVTTLKEAWDEKPSPLCLIDRKPVDVPLVRQDGTDIPISELSESEAQRYLAKCIRDPAVIDPAVDLFLGFLKKARAINESCAGIVFTGSDRVDDDEDNKIAKMVQEIIQEKQGDYGMDLDVRIVTMKSLEDKSSDEVLRKFKSGQYDVLLLKQIGGRGYDVPRLKVLLDLSSVRTVASVVQRLFRVATIFGDMKLGHVITLNDPAMTSIWNDYVVLAGGDWEQRRTTATLVDTYDVTPEPGPEPMWIGEGYLSGFDDTQGRMGEAKWKPIIDWLMEIAPDWGKQEGYAYFAEKFDQHGPPPGLENGTFPARGKMSTGAKISKLRSDVVTHHRQSAVKELGAWPKSDKAAQKTWKNGAWQIWKDGCKYCDLDPGEVNLKAITNIETLIKLRSYFTARAN